MADAPAPATPAAGPSPPGETTRSPQLGIPGLRVGRYTLTRSIGRGGMGEVFLARDSLLKRDVAIKAIIPDLARHQDHGSSALREARAIARLNHPHIATVYDVLEVDDHAYVVMEYLHGETLAQRLARGPLSMGDAARLGCQLAQALAHAHAHSIVHCDLKPANVFLTPEAGLKVVDFGLARALGGSQPAGTTDAVGASPSLIASRAGTPAYMSPEHRHGFALDGRSDLYCAGLILHEMVSGRLPERSDAPDPSATTTTPPAALRLHPSIPRPLRDVIATALQVEPSRRYQTALEMERALQPLVSEADRTKQRALKTAWWAVGALVLAMAVLVISLVNRPAPIVPAIASPFVIAVVPFSASASDESASLLAAGLAEVVTNDLTPYQGLLVAAPRPGTGRQADFSQLAKELGADALLLGNVHRDAGQLGVDLRIFRTDQVSFSQEVAVREPDHDLARLQASLANAVRTLLTSVGLKPSTLTSPTFGSAGQLLPSTLDAFEDYQQARTFLERADVAANVDHALTILDRVVAREPKYALAHAAIGEASWRKWTRTRDAQWSDRAHQSALEALRLAPEQPAVRYAVAVIYRGTGRRQEAIDELEQLIRLRPSWDDAYRLLGSLYADNGAFDQSINALNRAAGFRPGYWANFADLGLVYYRAGRYDDAIRAFERFVELRPDSATAYQRLGTAQYASGRVDRAVANYTRAVEIAPNANAYSNLGTALFDGGRYAEAVDAYQKAVDIERTNPSLHRNLGDAFSRAARPADARREYQQALKLVAAVLAVNPKSASMHSLRAVCLARLSRIDEAIAASRTAIELASADRDILYERSLVLVAANRPTEAVAVLRQAFEAGYSRTRAQGDQDLAPLKHLPAFQQLLAEGR